MAKKRDYISDEQVEVEINKLRNSPLVDLARKKKRIDYKRRQYLYQLRNFEKEGKKLSDAGITMEMLCSEEADMMNI